MALTAEHLIVIGRGRLIRDMSVADFIASASTSSVLVRSPDEAAPARPAARRRGRGRELRARPLEVTGTDAATRSATAPRTHGVTLLELSPVQASLEEAFMALTRDAVEYRAPDPRGIPA